jgi:hypothetical protein
LFGGTTLNFGSIFRDEDITVIVEEQWLKLEPNLLLSGVSMHSVFTG